MVGVRELKEALIDDTLDDLISPTTSSMMSLDRPMNLS
jgi:hypothetical protein